MPSLMDKLRMIDTAPAREKAPEEEITRDCYRKIVPFTIESFSPFHFATKDVLSELFLTPFDHEIKPEQTLFLDTETTGLSGGAGTLAFLVGLGYLKDGQFMVEQYLMRDYHEEGYMLEAVKRRMEQFPFLCTFNGRTFDVPLLKSRMILNRIKTDCIPALHGDLLPPSRRLWKLRLSKCRLGTLEEALLGVHRQDDLPGALVPETYFRYLKNRDFYPIERIMEHNRQDIVSLAQLLYYACMLLSKPESVCEQQDLFSMAKALERSNKQKAAKCYRLCVKGELRAPALSALAKREKQLGNAQGAAAIYRKLLSQGDDPAYACESLAKLYEHQLKNPEQALAYTRQALLILAEPRLTEDGTVQERQIALQYRYARLMRNLSARKRGENAEEN